MNELDKMNLVNMANAMLEVTNRICARLTDINETLKDFVDHATNIYIRPDSPKI